MAVPVDLASGHGVTRDVSEIGVLFETKMAMHLGDEVEFALLLGECDPGGRYRVRCSGQVVRVEAMANAYVIAVRLHSYSL